MKFKKISILILAAAAIGFTACNDGGNGSGTTRIEVRLTDAPGPYDEVNVDIQSVMINATSEESSGWQTLTLLEPGVYNLLEFMNGADVLLADQDIPSGRISQIRLVLGTENSVVVDGTSYPLATPSAQQSGLKLNLHDVLKPDVAYRLWIDFDAQRSVVKQGNGSYSLKPVIRAYTEASGGSISGNVTPAAAETIVWAVIGTDSLAAYPDATTGDFLFSGLTPTTTWKVGYDASDASGYADQVVTGITVTKGAVTALDPVVLQQQPQ